MRVSVMIPSRGRPALLEQAIQSLLDRAADPGVVEILVRSDEDDDSMRGWHHEWSRVLVGPRGTGYENMATYWNELAGNAQGDWLFCFNDDAIMETDDWDLLLPLRRSEVALAPYDNSTSYGWPAFPLVPRWMYERLGHITRFAGLDSWTVRVHEQGNRRLGRIPAQVYHRRAELRDQTHSEGQAAVARLCRDFDVDRRQHWEDLARQDARLLWP